MFATELDINPHETAWTFGGQGTQYKGMLGELLAKDNPTQDLIKNATNILGLDIGKLMLEGPEEELLQTANAQKAIFLAGVSYANVLRRYLPQPRLFLGHSVGLLTAIYEAGGYDFQAGLELVSRRGVAMEIACNPPSEASGLLAVQITAEKRELFDEAIKSTDVFNGFLICLRNSPVQEVYGGRRVQLKDAKDFLKARSKITSVVVPVAGAFHHPKYMEPAVIPFEETLDCLNSQFSPLSGDVLSNRTSEWISSVPEISQELLGQLITMVNWQGNIEKAAREFGIKHFIDIGPRKILANMNPKILNSLDPVEITDPDGLVIAHYTATQS